MCAGGDTGGPEPSEGDGTVPVRNRRVPKVSLFFCFYVRCYLREFNIGALRVAREGRGGMAGSGNEGAPSTPPEDTLTWSAPRRRSEQRKVHQFSLILLSAFYMLCPRYFVCYLAAILAFFLFCTFPVVFLFV